MLGHNASHPSLTGPTQGAGMATGVLTGTADVSVPTHSKIVVFDHCINP